MPPTGEFETIKRIDTPEGGSDYLAVSRHTTPDDEVDRIVLREFVDERTPHRTRVVALDPDPENLDELGAVLVRLSSDLE